MCVYVCVVLGEYLWMQVCEFISDRQIRDGKWECSQVVDRVLIGVDNNVGNIWVLKQVLQFPL